MASLAPFVVTARLAALAVNPASAEAQAEMRRMVSEKMLATGEAAVAAGFQMMREGLRASQALARGDAPAVAAAADRTGRRAMRPYSRRVRANARRLTGKGGAS